jgi:hypothetical protein
MNKLIKHAAAVVVLTAAILGGFFVGYRATILNAEVTFFNSQTVAVTVWGHTDLYAMEVYK